MIHRARFVIPVDGEVIEDGVVESERGLIVDVRKAAAADKTSRAVKCGTGFQPVEQGDVALFPGFVNAHTHLELTYLAGKVPPDGDFIGWLERLVQISIASPIDSALIRRSTAQGIEQSLMSGVTTIGDITRHPNETRAVLAKSSLRIVSFGEVIAIGGCRDQLQPRLNAALPKSVIRSPRSLIPNRQSSIDLQPRSHTLRIGVSPHSPYTVEPEGLRACAARATAQNAPLCIHLAETRHEDEFARQGTGALTDYLRRLNVWDNRIPVGGCDAIELVMRCGVLTPRSIAAHVNYVTDDQLTSFASTGAHVVYCPRTHHAFGHQPHRFRDMLAMGVNVCIGTDSLASSPSLSVLDELRFLHRAYPDFPAAELIRMGTIRGARALGLDSEVGSLAPGKRADLVAVALDPRGPAGPLTNVLESTNQSRVVPNPVL